MPDFDEDDNAVSWTKDWPTEPGYYWFHGWCWRSREDEPELHFVKVRHVRSAEGRPATIHITNGHFIWRGEGADGYWMPARVPEPPRQGEDSE